MADQPLQPTEEIKYSYPGNSSGESNVFLPKDAQFIVDCMMRYALNKVYMYKYTNDLCESIMKMMKISIKETKKQTIVTNNDSFREAINGTKWDGVAKSSNDSTHLDLDSFIRFIGSKNEFEQDDVFCFLFGAKNPLPFKNTESNNYEQPENAKISTIVHRASNNFKDFVYFLEDINYLNIDGGLVDKKITVANLRIKADKWAEKQKFEKTNLITFLQTFVNDEEPILGILTAAVNEIVNASLLIISQLKNKNLVEKKRGIAELIKITSWYRMHPEFTVSNNDHRTFCINIDENFNVRNKKDEFSKPNEGYQIIQKEDQLKNQILFNVVSTTVLSEKEETGKQTVFPAVFANFFKKIKEINEETKTNIKVYIFVYDTNQSQYLTQIIEKCENATVKVLVWSPLVNSSELFVNTLKNDKEKQDMINEHRENSLINWDGWINFMGFVPYCDYRDLRLLQEFVYDNLQTKNDKLQANNDSVLRQLVMNTYKPKEIEIKNEKMFELFSKSVKTAVLPMDNVKNNEYKQILMNHAFERTFCVMVNSLSHTTMKSIEKGDHSTSSLYYWFMYKLKKSLKLKSLYPTTPNSIDSWE